MGRIKKPKLSDLSEEEYEELVQRKICNLCRKEAKPLCEDECEDEYCWDIEV